MRKCTKCQLSLPPEAFHRGKTSRCKSCANADYREKWKIYKGKPHPLPIKPIPKEKACPRCSIVLPLSAFCIRPNGRPQSWCIKCTERYVREHYEDRYRELHHAIYLRRKDKAAEWNRQWCQANREKKNAQGKVRYARECAAGGAFTAADMDRLLEMYGNRCLCCGKSGEEVKLIADHVIPLFMNGSNDISNRQPLCKSCDSRKWRRSTDFRPKEVA